MLAIKKILPFLTAIARSFYLVSPPSQKRKTRNKTDGLLPFIQSVKVITPVEVVETNPPAVLGRKNINKKTMRPSSVT